MFNPNIFRPPTVGNPEMQDLLARLDLMRRAFHADHVRIQEVVQLLRQQAQELQSLRSLMIKALSAKPKLPFWRRWFRRKVTQQ